MVKKQVKKGAKRTRRITIPRRGPMRVLEVRSANQIKELEALLAKGPMTLVLVFADWCPACHRFMKNIWKPVEGVPAASMNRVAIREDLVPNTSLSNSKFQYLPSLLVVGPDKKPAEFTTPEGQKTNAMPTPQSAQELTQIVNSKPSTLSTQSSPNRLPPTTPTSFMEPSPERKSDELSPLEPNIPEDRTIPQDTTIPEDTIPRRNLQQKGGCGCSLGVLQTGSGEKQKGGGLYDTLLTVGRGAAPAALLGTLAVIASRRTRRRGHRRS